MNATVTELGGDSLIRFGRLTGGQVNIVESSGSTGLVPNTSFPFVIGVPASQLPTAGQFNYSLIGATSPVAINGSGSPGTFAGSMSIRFTSVGSLVGSNSIVSISNGAAGLLVGLTGSVTMPGDGVYPFQTVGGLTNVNAQLGSSTNIITGFGPQFSGLLSLIGPANGKACSGSSCAMSISGFLAGPAAARAGLSYVIGNSARFGPTSIIGVAAFARN